MVSSKVKQDNAEINFVSTGLNLMKKNVPLGAFWHRLGQVNFFGSSKTSAWFESLDSKVKDSLSIALVEDMKNMANEPLLKTNESLSDREKAIKISQRFKDQNPNFHPSGLHLLPFPLSLMNKKQKLKYLANSISEEANKNNHGRLSFAEEESKPSWWLEEMWGWINVNKSLHSIKETMYTGEGTFDEFITKSMINLLHLAGMDPERDILSMEGKSNILAKKRKQRGILEPSKALEYAEIEKVQPQHNKFVGFTTPRLSSNPIRSTLSSQPVTYCTPTSTPPPGQEQAQYGLSHEGSSGSSNFESPKQSNEKLEGNDDLNENEVLLTEVFESVNTASEISSEVLKEVPLIGSLSSFDLLNSGKDGGQFTYQPRRAIGDSPFKCATNSAKIKKRKIQFQGFDRSKKSKVDSTAFVKVPGALESQLGDCMIQRNSGGCSSSLYKAAMQHVNVGNFVASEEGFEQLQSFAHAKLVEWWPSFGHLFSFPTEVKVESENNIRMVKIPDGEAFKKFLKSDESLYASLSKEVEIWILSYVLNTYIFLLTCDVHDQAVPGSALVGVPQWKTYAGTNVVSGLVSPYTSNTNNLWLIEKDFDEYERAAHIKEVELLERQKKIMGDEVVNNQNVENERLFNDGLSKVSSGKYKNGQIKQPMRKDIKDKLKRKSKQFNRKCETNFQMPFVEPKLIKKNVKSQKPSLKRSARVADYKKPGLTGIKNLGNTCYMNSILQCLTNSPPLLKYFMTRNSEHELNCNNEAKGQLAMEFTEVMSNLWSSQNFCVSPLDFKNIIGRLKREFAGRKQQDSHEFLCKMLEWLHGDTNKVVFPGKELEQNCTDSKDTAAAKRHWRNYLERNQSIIVQLFCGQSRSTVKCVSCKVESVTYREFTNLTLPLPENSSYVCLGDCFGEYLKEEIAEKFSCDMCGSSGNATKKTDIVKLPPLLVIHLKRFGQVGNKTKKKYQTVHFDLQNLDIGQFAMDSFENKFFKFNLYAVSNHVGSLNGGHYTAFCSNNPLKSWFKFDDQVVSNLDPSDVVTPAAYVLFYSALVGSD